MKDGVDRRIDTVEQANLVGLQRQSQVGDDRFPQAVVLGVNADLISGDGPQGFDNAGAGADGVLVEVEAQQRPASLQGSAIGMEALHFRASRWPRLLHHIRSSVGMPNRPNPSLRVSAVRRQRARREGRASGSALSTGTWS